MKPSPKQTFCRADAFFGLHFDLHPREDDTSLGADITEENIARLLERVRPDYVQYDCKGHNGYTGYPSEVGWPSPGIVKDSLAIWRKVTRAHGVGLFIHYSGVWDDVAVKHHPEWAAIDAEGKPYGGNTSVFSGYVDELMIPQLKEVVARYELDGLWVDGDCWAARLDYSEPALRAWREETGWSDAPKDKSDPHWLEWKMFHRRRFEDYLRRWVDALHAFRPGLQIASNWMYSTFAPKPVEANVDYLSGDYSPISSVDRARTDARYFANTGMPWDLMAWGFNRSAGYGQELKPSIHLMQEAAVVLMQGGGFQIYYQPTRAGYLCDQIIETAREVAEFCRARKAVSFRSRSVPQVALLLSAESQWDKSDAVYAPYGCLDELDGMLHALLELHYSVDILAEHQLEPRLGEFPLVVLPDAHRLPEGFRQALLDYVDRGGSLLLAGEKSARLFKDVLGVVFEEDDVENRDKGQPIAAEIPTRSGWISVHGIWAKVRPTSAQRTWLRYPTRDKRKTGEVAATVGSFGKGRIGAIYGPVPQAYFHMHHAALRALIGELVAELFPNPAVETDAPACVDLALRRTVDGKLAVHLLNLTNAQRGEQFLSTDFVPTLGPITIRLHVPFQPKSARWISGEGEEELTLRRVDRENTWIVTVPRLKIHGVVVLEV